MVTNSVPIERLYFEHSHEKPTKVSLDAQSSPHVYKVGVVAADTIKYQGHDHAPLYFRGSAQARKELAKVSPGLAFPESPKALYRIME